MPAFRRQSSILAGNLASRSLAAGALKLTHSS